jgi:nicotinate-nucleotide--dimethylbenzimidazole phosphoribosyltransferase
LIDGLFPSAGALIAYGLAPEAADYMIAAHRSVEQGHRAALDYLKKQPLLDLDLRLGEGTGGSEAMTQEQAEGRKLTEVATFAEASVSEADK